jgi:LysM repeat protein
MLIKKLAIFAIIAGYIVLSGCVFKSKTETQDLPPKDIVHLVIKGETLGRIAKQYSGDAANYTFILRANPGLDPKKLKIGSEVIIPGYILENEKLKENQISRPARKKRVKNENQPLAKSKSIEVGEEVEIKEKLPDNNLESHASTTPSLSIEKEDDLVPFGDIPEKSEIENSNQRLEDELRALEATSSAMILASPSPTNLPSPVKTQDKTTKSLLEEMLDGE